jgi:hypothetical protein
MVRYYAFVRENRVPLEENSGDLNVAWLSDEAHVHLDVYVNRQKSDLGFRES